jgi:hypothetical protein
MGWWILDRLGVLLCGAGRGWPWLDQSSLICLRRSELAGGWLQSWYLRVVERLGFLKRKEIYTVVKHIERMMWMTVNLLMVTLTKKRMDWRIVQPFSPQGSRCFR